MKVIAIYNIKGGTGKTATAVNLAYQASISGLRTLIIDLDPQASTTFYFRVKPKVKKGGMGLVEGGDRVFKSIKGTDFPNLDLLPADFSFRNLDVLLSENKRSDKRLRDVIKPFKKDYDVVFLDCPPNLTLLSENIFKASHLVLSPVVPTVLSSRTLLQLLTFFENEGLDKRKILPFFSMVELRKKMHLEMMRDLPDEVPDFLDNWIPYAADVEKMGVYRRPVNVFAKGSRSGRAYELLWSEIQARFGAWPT